MLVHGAEKDIVKDKQLDTSKAAVGSVPGLGDGIENVDPLAFHVS